ncbi:MAG: TniQ family protein [Marinomonas sp.]|uniref:TniQ family protein n=1 Tax=Marinomonas sp. TaxID=1904862 RepID=UPI003F9E58CC
MSFLPNSIDLYEDEALESALLRICRANHFEHYSDLSIEVKSWLEEYHPTVAGAFPLSLDAVNIYHAKQSSAQRVQAIQLLEQLVGLSRFSLLDICFKHTTTVDLGQYAEVRYKQIIILRGLLRSTIIPICPECLKESNYVRFAWHINKVECCEKHGIKLLRNCPSCHIPLNYMNSEDPGRCICGQNLLENSHREVGFDSWRDDSLYEAIGSCSLSEKLAVLVFSDKFFPLLAYEDFIVDPRRHIDEYLKGLIEQNLLLATEKPNRLAFAQISNDFLDDISAISCLSAKIKEFIADTVITIATNEARSTIANIGDTLVSAREAAVIIGSELDDIYRLYESGILVVGRRLRNEGKLESHNPVFRVRDVASLALSYSKYQFSQSAW